MSTIDITALCCDFRIENVTEGHHHAHQGWVQVHCPFCGDGTHGFHLGFNIEQGYLNCWRCGKHSIYQWLSNILPPSRKNQITDIIKKYSVRPGTFKKTNASKIRKKNTPPPLGCGELSKKHVEYLKKRKYDPQELIELWDLRGTMHLSLEWNWRVIAPIADQSGRVVGYTGRTISKTMKPRWKTTDDEDLAIDPKKLIYGIDKADEANGVLIVEGPSDVWRMGYGAVGLLGIDWKIEQACILRKFPRRFIMFDAGVVAQKRARKLAEWLAPFPGETEIITGINSDPGDLPQKKAKKIMLELGLN